MTALTPQQMRELADKLVERASLERHGSYDEWLDSASYTALRTAADEVDLLRAEIENAPHEPECSFLYYGFPVRCNCWKADAL